jgi:hypothetical protein
MGFKLQGVFLCGACGKPRGLGTHLCSPGKRRRGRTTVRNPVGWECRTCHQPRGLMHTCTQRTDFRARKRKAATADRQRKRKAVRERRTARRKQAAADRRARDRARKKAAKTRPRGPRPKGDSHEPGSCGDRDCPRYGCKNYWRGMDDCPRMHEGE